MKKTKLERAVERVESMLLNAPMFLSEKDALRTVLAALKARTPSAVTRAERAVVMAAMRFATHPGVHTAGPVYFRVRQLESAKANAKKARRP